MKNIHFITVRILTCGLILLSLGLVWPFGFAKRPITDYVHTILQTPLLALATQPSSQNQGQNLPRAYGAKENARFLDQQLHESWAYYKTKFMTDQTTHVVSNNYGGTITEGQSYALLKALWMNEPQTFNGIWQWTKVNMARPNDRLLGWRWSDGAPGWDGRDTKPRGLIEAENATDADQDIAYALLLAGEKWKRSDYTEDGLAMARDIWRLNVQQVQGRYYLVPGTWEGFREGGRLTVNPSYFAPYVYQTFAQADTEHATGWKQLANDIYDTLEACSRLTRPGLPPNWCAISLENEPSKSRHRSALPEMVFSDLQGAGSRDFSYDAFRVYWRMGMDARLSPLPGRAKALTYLKRHPFLFRYWLKKHYAPEGFTADGHPRDTSHSGFAAGPVLVLNHAMHMTMKNKPLTNAQAWQERQLYDAVLGKAYHSEGYWFNDYNDFLHSVIWLHLYALQLQ